MSVYETTSEWETPELEYGETAGEFGEFGEFGESEFGESEVNEYAGESESFLGGLLGSVLGGEVGEAESPLTEVQEMEAATELLEVTSEAELDRFLGNLVKSVGGFMRSGTGKALGGILKGVAKKVLPIAGGALGSFVAPGVGTALGSKLGSMASNLFEMELEGLNEQEAEFEIARRYVRLASTAAGHAARAPRNAPPQAVARAAIVASARKHAPGMLRGTPYQSPRRPGTPAARRGAPGRVTGRPGRQRPRRRSRPGVGAGYSYGYPVDEPYADQNGSTGGWATDGGYSGGDGGGWDSDDAYPDSSYADSGSPVRRRPRAQTGRWVRRGAKIVILGS